MLKKRLGAEAIESSWSFDYIYLYYKIPSTLIIPESCKVIGRHAFDGCWNIKKVIIPESVEWIGSCIFSGCWAVNIESKKPVWLSFCADSLLSRRAVITSFKLNFRFIRRYFRYFKELFNFFFSSKSLIYEKNK